MSTKQVDPLGYKQFTPPGWAGHGTVTHFSTLDARIAAGFVVNNPESFKAAEKSFFRDFSEVYDFSPSGAMEQASYVLYHICKQEAPNIYAITISLLKELYDDRVTVDQIQARISELIQHAEKTKCFFKEVKKAVPRCSWNRKQEPLEDVIYELILKEKEDDWRRRHPPGD